MLVMILSFLYYTSLLQCPTLAKNLGPYIVKGTWIWSVQKKLGAAQQGPSDTASSARPEKNPARPGTDPVKSGSKSGPARAGPGAGRARCQCGLASESVLAGWLHYRTHPPAGLRHGDTEESRAGRTALEQGHGPGWEAWAVRAAA